MSPLDRFDEHTDKETPNVKASRNMKKSGNLNLELLKSNHIGNFLEAPKQSPESESPPPLAPPEEKPKERLSAKDRWAKGKAILRGGERESQKSQHSTASGGSTGSAGQQTPASISNTVPRYILSSYS